MKKSWENGENLVFQGLYCIGWVGQKKAKFLWFLKFCQTFLISKGGLFQDALWPFGRFWMVSYLWKLILRSLGLRQSHKKMVKIWCLMASTVSREHDQTIVTFHDFSIFLKVFSNRKEVCSRTVSNLLEGSKCFLIFEN